MEELTYSRDECVAAVRDYYEFLTKMYMNPSFIIEPPPDGWPAVTQDTMKDLGKTEEVIELLRRLPYIRNRPYSDRPDGLPSITFIDWEYVALELQTGQKYPENELLMSEGIDDQFGGRIPSHCIGLVQGGYMWDNEEPDVILLDTKAGVVYWMDCPQKVRESASPQSSHLIYNDEERVQMGEQDKNEGREENDQHGDEEDEEEGGDEDSDEDSDEDEDNIRWGPCWPVRHFFEMLKNQYRQLNFMAKDPNNVIDIWTGTIDDDYPIPDGFTNHLQAIYRKHGWPDLSKYQKGECMAELKRVLEDEYPGNHMYYYRDG